jgi:2,4-dienoyl-CoA reductase (NADPH2)
MLQHLFNPVNIGSLSLPNRAVMTAVHLGMADENGRVSKKIIDFYKERAKNGVGFIITGVTYFHPSGRGYLGLKNMIGLHDDNAIEGISDLARALKSYGTKLAVQISHPGAHAFSHLSGETAVSPSGLSSEMTGEKTKALSLSEIAHISDQYAEAARKVKDAGVAAVEILCGKALIGQFLSPQTNNRKDEYGGSLRGRMKFALDILQKVKEKTGADYPVIYRILAEDFYKGNRTREEAHIFSKALEKLGVDALDVTVESHAARVPRDTMEVPPGTFLYLSKALKTSVSVPIIGNVRINDPILAEKAISSEQLDLVGIARGFLADPEFIIKSKENRINEIRKCIACCQGCLGRIIDGKPLACLINPQVGKEKDGQIIPAAKKKKVLIIGGGPGGMMSAWVLAKRKHDTYLFEEQSHLGGQLQVAIIPPGRQGFKLFLEYMTRELGNLPIQIKMGYRATPKLIAEENPDVVIIATGAIPYTPDIPGIDREHVYSANDVFKGHAKIGNKVTVIGGGAVGCEVALYLAKKDLLTSEQLQFFAEWEAMEFREASDMSMSDCSITLLEMTEEVGADLELHNRRAILANLERYQVILHPKAEAVQISDDRVYYLNDEGERSFIVSDTVVVALGYQSNDELYHNIRNSYREVYRIGDCIKPRTAMEAIHEGYEIGLKI